jgi:hypothetical protein
LSEGDIEILHGFAEEPENDEVDADGQQGERAEKDNGTR